MDECMNSKISDKAVFLVDGSSFLYRAYYGLKPLHTSKGLTVQAVYGFCRMIKKLIDTYNVKHLVIVWDSKGKTDRQAMYPEYKATRQAAPSDLFTQKEFITRFAELINIEQLSLTGAEADDLMYSLAKKVNRQDYQAVIVSSDKDMRQAISEQIFILDPFKDVFMDEESCEKRYGFHVAKLPFYFAILGDSSDNIPGIKGIGEKGATGLVKNFSNLQDLYDNLDKVPKERTRMLLLANKENAFLSEGLFLLKTYAISTDMQDIAFDPKNWANALPLFQELEFKSLVADIQKKYDIVVEAPESVAAIPLEQKYRFELVDTEQKLIDLCKQLQKHKAFAVDTETTGLDPMQAELIGISVSYEEGSAFYIPFGHKCEMQQSLLKADSSTLIQLSKDVVFKHLKSIFQDATIKKYLHNAKFDGLVFMQAGIRLSGIFFDTLIAANLLLKEWEKKGLKELSKQLFDEDMISYQDIVKKHKAVDFSYVPLKDAMIYAAADAHQTLKLFHTFEKQLRDRHLDRLFYEIEMPTCAVLTDMQREGIYCDSQVLAELGCKISADLERIEQNIYGLIGREINLNSPKQIKELLFDELKLTPQGKTDSGKTFSTDSQALLLLSAEHEVPGMILKYRELYKLKSTYVEALPTYINKLTGRIHTSWNQTLVATGRLSSADPNLQNIPKDGHGYDIDVRSAFKSKQGWTFISADYSQIELRILAEFSSDISLVNAFLHDKDIHAQTAAKLFDVDEKKVTSEQRDIGKRINFSVLYGLTPYGLSRDMQISYAQAKQYIDRYFEQYKDVQEWMNEVVASTQRNGYTQTFFGRRRYVPGIYEKNKTLFELARRIAINTPAQGTAAEITKLGMLAFQRALHDQCLEGKIILQIHDELLISCPDNEVEKTRELLKHCLESVVNFKIPLIVSTKIGKNWREVTK